MDRIHQMVGDSEILLFVVAAVAGVVAGAAARLFAGLRRKPAGR